MTVVKNDNNEFIPTRTVIGRHVCMDYRKLNKATRKNHFPRPFIDQMLDRLAGYSYYCFLDGYSGHNQVAIAPKIRRKLYSYATTEHLLLEGCPLDCVMPQQHFNVA